jgi:hypothetical protein
MPFLVLTEETSRQRPDVCGEALCWIEEERRILQIDRFAEPGD